MFGITIIEAAGVVKLCSEFGLIAAQKPEGDWSIDFRDKVIIINSLFRFKAVGPHTGLLQIYSYLRYPKYANNRVGC